MIIYNYIPFHNQITLHYITLHEYLIHYNKSQNKQLRDSYALPDTQTGATQTIPFDINDLSPDENENEQEPNSQYDINNLPILNIHEHMEMDLIDQQHEPFDTPPHQHRFSLFSVGSELSTMDDAPFFARRGSLSITGPTSLRWVLSNSQVADPMQSRDITPSHTPNTSQLQFPYQSFPNPSPPGLAPIDSEPIPDDASPPLPPSPPKQTYFQYSVNDEHQ